MDHKAIIEALGGHKEVAPALGVSENRVCHWKIRGIPPWYWAAFVNLSREKGDHTLDLNDLQAGRRMKHHAPPDSSSQQDATQRSDLNKGPRKKPSESMSISKM